MAGEPCRCHYGGEFDGRPHLHATLKVRVTKSLLDDLEKDHKSAVADFEERVLGFSSTRAEEEGVEDDG